MRAEDALRTALTFFIIHGNAVLTILQQSGPGAFILRNAAFLGTKTTIATPGPPSVIRPATIDGALAGNGNVPGLEGIHTGREVKAFQSLPGGLHDWVELGLEGKLKYGSFLHFEVDTTLQLDGSRQELATSRHHHPATTFLRTAVDGFLDGLLILCGSGIGLGTKLSNQVRLVGKLGHTNTLFYLLILSSVPILGIGQGRHQQTEHQNLK